jgi:hypothetical protein
MSLAGLCVAAGAASWKRWARRNFWLPLAGVELAHVRVVAGGALDLPLRRVAGGLQRQQRLVAARCARRARCRCRRRPALLRIHRAQFAVARGQRAAEGDRDRVVVAQVGAEEAREAGGCLRRRASCRPAPVPCHRDATLALPLSTLTLPMASVPSWHDRHSLELPPGWSLRPSVMTARPSTGGVGRVGAPSGTRRFHSGARSGVAALVGLRGAVRRVAEHADLAGAPAPTRACRPARWPTGCAACCARRRRAARRPGAPAASAGQHEPAPNSRRRRARISLPPGTGTARRGR